MGIKKNMGYQRFEYTGNVQEFIIPTNGLYQLEVFGASGGTSKSQTGSANGGLGGYSVGYKYLTKGEVIYITVGGKGETCPEPIDHGDGDWEGKKITGGYNGGGGASAYCNNGENNNEWIHQGGAGGGATHIATTNRGELKNYANYKSELIIVAGGGGGGSYILENYEGWNIQGGNGGGLEGGVPLVVFYDHREDEDATWTIDEKHKSTQTTGYIFGEGSTGYCGGGGGLYGGNYHDTGAFGGSGYIDGVPPIVYKGKTYNPSTVIGNNNGNGAAIITLMQKPIPSIYLGTKEISAIYFGTREINDIKIHN